MHANSSSVVTNQSGIHEHLAAQVLKHCQTAFQRPIAPHAHQAVDDLKAARRKFGEHKPLILDSGCGTGRSTAHIAANYPDAFVVGVDRSAQRLAKSAVLPNNACFIRSNLEDFWRLLAAEDIRLSHHFLLYPNPYPKASQLRYRWHGSPVFPVLLALGGRLLLRSNWLLYLQEFAAAFELLGGQAEVAQLDFQQKPITAFEEKYQASGQALYQLKADCSLLQLSERRAD